MEISKYVEGAEDEGEEGLGGGGSNNQEKSQIFSKLKTSELPLFPSSPPSLTPLDLPLVSSRDGGM